MEREIIRNRRLLALMRAAGCISLGTNGYSGICIGGQYDGELITDPTDVLVYYEQTTSPIGQNIATTHRYFYQAIDMGCPDLFRAWVHEDLCEQHLRTTLKMRLGMSSHLFDLVSTEVAHRSDYFVRIDELEECGMPSDIADLLREVGTLSVDSHNSEHDVANRRYEFTLSLTERDMHQGARSDLTRSLTVKPLSEKQSR